MPRQKKTRTIENPPIYDGYKPLGISAKHIDYVDLRLEEYEAIRLADYVNLRQEEAALRMNISRPTFTRIYNSARKKIAQAFVEGKMLLFKGGDINIDQHWEINQPAWGELHRPAPSSLYQNAYINTE